MSIISKKVSIIVGSQQVNYYKSLKYLNVKFRESLIIDIIHLPIKSMVKIDAMCDNCHATSSIRYQDYNKLVSKYTNYYCKDCKGKRIEETCLSKYKVKNVSQLKYIQDKKILTSIQNYGVTHPMKSLVLVNRMLSTHKENFGCHYTQTDIHKNNMSNYIKSVYGENNSFLNIETMIDKYGVNHPSKSIELMSKRNRTNIDLYNNICSLHGIEQKEKTIITWYNNLGVNHPFKSDIVKSKIKNTFNIKYNVDNPSQIPEIHNKKLKSAFSIGDIYELNYQGSYERDFLLMCYENNIIDKISNGPTIRYIFNENSHYYHSDFYIEEYDLIIEIKSSYIYNLELDKNIAKQNYCLRNGYNFLFIIDKNYSELMDLYIIHDKMRDM